MFGVFYNNRVRCDMYAGNYSTWEIACEKANLAQVKSPTRSYYVSTLIPEPCKLADSKAALNSGLKPDITHVRTPIMNYIARASEWGNAKGYQRANYQRVTGSVAEDFRRLRAYIRAEISHAMKCVDSMEAHEANDPELKDIEGMRKACFAPDEDDNPPSMLPHLCGSGASLNMALVQAVNAGLLPLDPGQPWTKK